MTDNFTIRLYGASPDGLREALQTFILRSHPDPHDFGERCECSKCREQREIAWERIQQEITEEFSQ